MSGPPPQPQRTASVGPQNVPPTPGHPPQQPAQPQSQQNLNQIVSTVFPLHFFVFPFLSRSVAPRSCDLAAVSLALSSLARIYQTKKPTRPHQLHICLLACFNTLIYLPSSVVSRRTCLKYMLFLYHFHIFLPNHQSSTTHHG